LDMSNNSIINVNTIYFTDGVALSPGQISQPNFACQNLTVTQTSTLNILNVSGVTTFTTNPFVTTPTLSPETNQLVTKGYIDTVTNLWSKTGSLLYPATIINTVSIGSSSTNGSTLYIAGTLGVTSDATISGLTSTTGITNTGSISTSTLAVTSNATIAGTLGVTGTTNTRGIVNTGTISSTGQISALSTLSVGSNATITGILDVIGTTETHGIANTGTISSTGQINALSSLNVSGSTTLAGSSITLSTIPFTLGDNVLTYDSSTKKVGYYGNSNAWTLNTAVTPNNLYPNQTSYVVAIGKNSVTTGLALDVAGSANISGNLGVTSNATITGTLGVTGATSTTGISNTGIITSTGQINAGANLVVSGNATMLGSMTVVGNTTLEENLTVTGTASATGGLSTSSTLSVSGNATIEGSTISFTGIPNQNPSSTYLTYDTTTKKIGYYVDASGSGQSVWTLTGTTLYPTSYATNVVAIGKNTVTSGMSLDVSGNANISGNINGTSLRVAYILNTGPGIPIGGGAGETGQGSNAIAIGYGAGQSNQLSSAISIGTASGNTSQRSNAIAIGSGAGNKTQSSDAIAIGTSAAFTGQGSNAIAIGSGAAFTSQGSDAIAIGLKAGLISQLTNAVAIGPNAGSSNQGSNSVAIGANAGLTSQEPNTIILNATNNPLNSVTGTSNAFYVAPIRNTSTAPNATNYSLTYDTVTSEIYYSQSNWTLSSTTASLLTTTSQVQAPTFSTTSDYRIKTEVTPIFPEESTKIYMLNPLQYKNTLTGKQDYGLFAHEVQSVFPNIVNGEKDQEDCLQSINYTSLIPLLLKEIQDLKKQVTQLQQQLNTI